YSDIFAKKASERMPTRTLYDHAFEPLPGASLSKLAKLYPLEQNLLVAWITEQEGKGYIHMSKSPTAVSVFFVRKKDGSLRLVQDYRALNTVTKKDKFP
ncbi:hypothetical protein DICSQDRAFT_64498, partial [Dichomitus squalens LYAD-421 SS1]